MPKITGTFGSGCLMNWQESYVSGALYRATITQSPQNAGGTDGGGTMAIGFDASKSNSIYGATTYVRPQSIGVRFIIRYI